MTEIRVHGWVARRAAVASWSPGIETRRGKQFFSGSVPLFHGKLNPADVTTKALDKAVTVAHSGVISGQAPIPIPKGCKVWHGPIDKPREIVGI